MARHIRHKYTSDEGYKFTREELSTAEIGVNLKSGTLSIIDENEKTIEFINKEMIDKSFSDLSNEITNVNSNLETRVQEIETNITDNINIKITELETAIDEMQDTIQGDIENSISDIGEQLKEMRETIQNDVEGSISDIEGQITEMQETIQENIETSISTIEEQLEEHYSQSETKFNDVDSRVTALEDAESIDGLTKVITSKEEPSEEYRNGYIWVQEIEEEIQEPDFQADIRVMQKAIIELTKIVQRHEYAFNDTMNCGTVTENSARKTLMKSANPEPPEGYFDGTAPKLIAEMLKDDKIANIINYYVANNLSYGVELKTDGWEEYIVDFNETNNYLWHHMSISYDSGKILYTEPQLILAYNSVRTLDKVKVYFALSDSRETAPEKSSDLYSEAIPSYDENNKYLWSYVNPVYLTMLQEKPNYSEYGEANVKHLIIKSSKTEQEIRNNLDNILNGELIWCEGNNGLYIKSKNKLVKINGEYISDPDDDENNDNNIEDIMAGISFINDGVGAIDFISSNGTKYTMKVTDNGDFSVYNSELDKEHPAPTGDASGTEGQYVGGLFLQKLYINSVYCGGIMDKNGKEINEHSINPCSHNFVELSNLTTEDINLNGLSIQYSTGDTDWQVLPLWGIIKAGSTFLIRGAQCSIMNLNTTVIKVTDYDMEWRDKNGELIKFDNTRAKFYLTYGTTPCTEINPFKNNIATPKDSTVLYGYIDLVGFQSGTNTIDAYEREAYKHLSSNYLLKKYYAMDNVSQATKDISKRKNSSDWYYVDLTRNDILPDITKYTPRASSYGKNIFYDKTSLLEEKPTIVTITFGIQATDNTAEGGQGATRCFNWVSKGYYDEYLWYREKGTSAWIRVESIKNETDRIRKNYNRIQQEATNGEVFTAHKLIISGLTKGVYEYTCGKSLKTQEPNMNACIDIREFSVRTDDEVNKGYTFIQVSDQQGFNWEEYQTWYYAAKYINENYKDTTHFIVNTGDMTQNGNRINEWIDYFNGKAPLDNFEEMATIGNNDLCPAVTYILGAGGNKDKINYANIHFYYTFEIDEDNPTIFVEGDTDYGYIPSIYSFNYGNTYFMCVNSEISEGTESTILGIPTEKKGTVYKLLKEWCERDIQLAKHKNCRWKIAYCHEMPFTIITNGVMGEYYDKSTKTENIAKEREGSRINTVNTVENMYWFSRFCQDNGIRLVMGGHKHTQSISWPLEENVINGKVVSMKPIIHVTLSDLQTYFTGATKLITVNDEGGNLDGQSFPETWFSEDVRDGKTTFSSKILSAFEAQCHFCSFKLVDSIKVPVYSMSQTTGYKHTSNKELPGDEIPWLRHYYPVKVGSSSPSSAQKRPFFSVYKVTPDKITIEVKRLLNIMEEGAFNINIQGEALKNGIKTVMEENGLSSSISTDSNVIINY